MRVAAWALGACTGLRATGVHRPAQVVLLDSYQVLHGREPFSGPREHGVMWLTSSEFAAPDAPFDAGPASLFSRAINGLAVTRT